MRASLLAAPLAALVAAAPFAARADLDYRLKVQAISEIDTNADRKEGGDGRTDGATRLLLRASVAHHPEAGTLVYARLDVGAKTFFHDSEDDLFVSSGTLVFQQRVGEHVVFAVDGQAKDRRERTSVTDYFLGQGGGTLQLLLGRGLSLKLRAAYGGFLFKPDDLDFGYQGDDYSATFTARPSLRTRLTVSYDFGRRAYRSHVLFAASGPDGVIQTFDGRDLHSDQVHTAEVRVRYVRGVYVEGSYLFQAVSSNSFGFSYTRHQIGLQVSAKLPGAIYFHVAGSAQILGLRDPLFLERTLFVEDDNRTWIAAKLSREIGKGFAIEARYEFYTSAFAADVLSYRRHVAGIGVAYAL